jgi:hypothetical protein
MEKVFIKPTAQEIIIKGTAADGHMDIFSYDPSDEATKRLGHLYVIGHVQHETDDMTYAINLISALAKREYYAKDNPSPKEAFAVTLKKINEVVEEFFEHKGVKINIGIFAVAGEQMYISKLGKFKILLARGDKTIDVLNNVMFDKEKVQEKQFSNVISGAVHEHDRILAYYPSKTVAARERYLKTYLLKYDSTQFADQLKSIKKEKDAFSCAMVYVQLAKVKEVATAPRIQPQELAQSQLVATATQPRKSRLAAAEPETQEPTETPVASYPTSSEPNSSLSSKDSTPATPPQDVKSIVTAPSRYVETHNEIPHIIPTEYSVGKKDNFVSTALSRIRLGHLSPKHKAIMSLSAVALVVGITFATQRILGIDPQAREAAATAKTAQEKLDLAKIKINQNENAEARAILSESLASLLSSDDSKVTAIRDELQQTLDALDQAEEASTSLVASVPVDEGKISLLYSGKELYAFVKSETAGSGTLLTISGDSVSRKRLVENTNPDYITSSTKGTPVLVDIGNQKTVALKDSGPEIATFTVPEPSGPSVIYEDNLYMITSANIYKFSNIFQGNIKPATWIKQGTESIADPKLIVVDGSIYTMNAQGELSVYFRGEKSNEFSTGLAVTNDHLLVASSEGASLYLVDKKTGKIYILDKKTGVLLKTLKIGSQEPIITATVGTDDTLYFLTNDNKIWKINK